MWNFKHYNQSPISKSSSHIVSNTDHKSQSKMTSSGSSSPIKYSNNSLGLSKSGKSRYSWSSGDKLVSMDWSSRRSRANSGSEARIESSIPSSGEPLKPNLFCWYSVNLPVILLKKIEL